MPADRARPQLVLVHGSRLSSTQWLPQLPLLEPHVGVHLVDLPGHGSRGADPFSLDSAADVVDAAVRRAAEEGPVVLVGHSLGGFVAMHDASVRGGPLAGLVLVGASARPQGLGAAVYRAVGALTDRLGPARMTRVNDRVLHRLYPAERIDPVVAGGYWFGVTTAAWREVMDRCRPAGLARLECPVLLVDGRWDQFRLGVPGFLRDVPDARVVTVRGAGHLVNLDQPQAFAEVLLRFAREVADSADGR